MTSSMRIGATLDALSDVGTFVLGVAAAAGLDRRAAYRLRLAVDEIVTNIVIHGQPTSDAEALIGIDAFTSADRLTVVVEDHGPAFDPIAHETPDAEDLRRPVAERQIGGLGVFLAIRGVDEFRYERHADANRNVFVVRLPAAPAQRST